MAVRALVLAEVPAIVQVVAPAMAVAMAVATVPEAAKVQVPPVAVAPVRADGIWQTPSANRAEVGKPSRWGNATAGIRGSRSARGGAGSMAVETGLMTLHEDELKGIMQMLAQIARTSEGSDQKLDSQPFQSRLSTLPRRARFTVSQALSALAAQAPSDSSDKPTLLKLAEHIAIRFAMESYERGDIEVNAVRQVLDEMSQELDSLRKIMGVYEEKMARHGIEVQSHSDMLAQQFWAQVPSEKRKAVLESGEAWCVPPAQIREYVEGLDHRTGKKPKPKKFSRTMPTASPTNRQRRAVRPPWASPNSPAPTPN